MAEIQRKAEGQSSELRYGTKQTSSSLYEGAEWGCGAPDAQEWIQGVEVLPSPWRHDGGTEHTPWSQVPALSFTCHRNLGKLHNLCASVSDNTT